MSTNGGANGAIKKFSRSTMSTSDAKDEIKKFSRLTMSASNGKDVIKNKIFTLIIIKKLLKLNVNISAQMQFFV